MSDASLRRFEGIPEFVAAAQSSSFTAAGLALGMTKSAVSKAVVRLEGRLDTKLFYRTTRRISLTSDGEAFLTACNSAIADVALFEEALGAEREVPAGRVRIDLPGAFGRRYIVPILVDLMGRFPGLEVSASFTDRRVDLVEDGIDIAVRIGPPPDSVDLVARQIGVQDLVICAAPSYLEKHGVPEDLGDLVHHRLIVGRRNRTRHMWLFRTPDGRSERRPIVGHHELGDGDAMLAAAVAGAGIAQLPTWLAFRQFSSAELVPILQARSGGTVPIFLLWMAGGGVPPRIRTVIDAIVELSDTWDFRASRDRSASERP